METEPGDLSGPMTSSLNVFVTHFVRSILIQAPPQKLLPPRPKIALFFLQLTVPGIPTGDEVLNYCARGRAIVRGGGVHGRALGDARGNINSAFQSLSRPIGAPDAEKIFRDFAHGLFP